jgi:hypothetical protein
MQDQTGEKIWVTWPWWPSVNQPIFVGFNHYEQSLKVDGL